MSEIIQTSLSDGGTRLVCDSINEPDAAAGLGWGTPLPLPSNLPPVLPFELHLLPETLRSWVGDVADRMQCPVDFVAAALIAAIGSVLGRKIAIRPKQHDDWQEVLNLWALIIARPGLLKTPAITQGLSALNHLESLALKKYDEELVVYRIASLVAAERTSHAKKKIAAALKDGHEEAARLEAENAVKSEVRPPVRRRYKVNDSTVEKFAELLTENPNGLMLYRDEFIGFLRSLDKEGREDSRAFFLEAATGTGDFTSDRIGRGTIRVEALTISILGSIQPGPLASYLRQAVKSGVGDDGLLQRFQLAVWPDLAREWHNVDRPPDLEAQKEVFKLFEYLDALTPDMVGADQTAKIPFLRFTLEAQSRFDDWRAKHELRVRSERDHPALTAHLAKYRKLVPALALILHLADRQAGPVTLTSLERALLWRDYLESHARRMYASVRRPDETAARELARHVEAGDLTAPFSARDVYRKGWTGLETKEDVEPAIEVLCELNWLRAVPLEPAKSGRPMGLTYEISPLLNVSTNTRAAKTAKMPAA